MKQATYNKRGFSLAEVIVAIFIITVGIIGVVSLMNSTISGVRVAKSQIIAANLAQEGLEIIRNIRDTNWQEDESWVNGLSDGDWRVQFNSTSLWAFSEIPLKISDNNRRYQYYNGSDTMFYRKVTISTISAYEIKVNSEVTWNERGRSFNVSAENRFYNWK